MATAARLAYTRRRFEIYDLLHAVGRSELGILWAAHLAGLEADSETAPTEAERCLVRLLELPAGGGAGLETRCRGLVAAGKDARALDHVGIVPVLDVVESAGEIGIVSKHIEGEPLSSLLLRAMVKGVGLDAPTAARVAIDVLDALAHLHDAQRSAKWRLAGGVTGGQILVGTDGHARLLEPSVAAIALSLEPWAARVAHAAYAAPETLRSKQAPTERSDVYATGVLLWEMIVGRSLFGGGSPDVIETRVASGAGERLAELGKVAPAAVAQIVARALEREPHRRIQSAHEMALALRSAIAPATRGQVGELVRSLCVGSITARRRAFARAERRPASTPPPRASMTRALSREAGRRPASPPASSWLQPAASSSAPESLQSVPSSPASAHRPPANAPGSAAREALRPPPLPSSGAGSDPVPEEVATTVLLSRKISHLIDDSLPTLLAPRRSARVGGRAGTDPNAAACAAVDCDPADAALDIRAAWSEPPPAKPSDAPVALDSSAAPRRIGSFLPQAACVALASALATLALRLYLPLDPPVRSAAVGADPPPAATTAAAARPAPPPSSATPAASASASAAPPPGEARGAAGGSATAPPRAPVTSP
jgi:serine/threonine-protein kinase